MTSTAFCMPDDGRQRVSIRRRATATATSTSAAADDALQHVLDRRLRKREGRLPPPRRQPVVGGGTAAVASWANRLGSPHWLLRAAVLAVVAVALGGTVWKLASGGHARHTVSGRVLLGKTPLRNAGITFHPAGGMSQDPVSLTTGPDGRFQLAEDQPLPAGLYAVVVDGGGRGVVVPASYRDPGTTPLRVLLTENLTGLQLLVRR